MTDPLINEAVSDASRHYAEATSLGGRDGAWRTAQIKDRPTLLARAQIEAALAVADELRALRLILESGHHA